MHFLFPSSAVFHRVSLSPSTSYSETNGFLSRFEKHSRQSLKENMTNIIFDIIIFASIFLEFILISFGNLTIHDIILICFLGNIDFICFLSNSFFKLRTKKRKKYHRRPRLGKMFDSKLERRRRRILSVRTAHHLRRCCCLWSS